MPRSLRCPLRSLACGLALAIGLLASFAGPGEAGDRELKVWQILSKDNLRVWVTGSCQKRGQAMFCALAGISVNDLYNRPGECVLGGWREELTLVRDGNFWRTEKNIDIQCGTKEVYVFSSDLSSFRFMNTIEPWAPASCNDIPFEEIYLSNGEPTRIDCTVVSTSFHESE